MHKNATVLKFKDRITKAVDDVFDLALKNQRTADDIVCFLSNGAYAFNQYVIGPGERGITDVYQKEFLINFMNSSEESSLSSQVNSVEEKKSLLLYTTNIELMLYSHLWESDISLSNLKHLANFIDCIDYDWHLEIPRKDKWKFITQTIRRVFERHDLDIAELMKETYNSQVRNAFAHSQYGFFDDQIIRLFNYKGHDYEIPALTFDDWEERFIKTVLLNVTIAKKKATLLKQISATKPILRIWVPSKHPPGYKRTYLYWNSFNNEYSFNRHPLLYPPSHP